MFGDEPLPREHPLACTVVAMKKPAVPCGCAACILAAIKSPNAARGQLSSCESMRRKRERSLLGTRMRDPNLGYTVQDLARFLGATIGSVRACAKRLRILRKREGDHWYAPLTRREAKRLIQAWRVKHHGP